MKGYIVKTVFFVFWHNLFCGDVKSVFIVLAILHADAVFPTPGKSPLKIVLLISFGLANSSFSSYSLSILVTFF